MYSRKIMVFSMSGMFRGFRCCIGVSAFDLVYILVPVDPIVLLHLAG